MAGELCVTCSEPQARYRCALEADDPNTPVQNGLQLLCLKQLAARGGHKTCSVDRLQPTAPCDAALVTLAPPTDGSLAPTVQSGSGEPVVPNSAVADAPPPTVEALAKATAEQSKQDWDNTNAKVKESTSAAGEKLGQAGSAVGSAVKKSIDCVVSLFSKC